MFNIESKYEDLVGLLNTNGLRPPTDIGQMAEELESEIGSMTEMLSVMYHDMQDIEWAAENNELVTHYPYVQGLGDLDENARAVMTDIITELCRGWQANIRDQTRFDRVDRR